MILLKRKERAHLEGLASLFPNPNFDELYSFEPLTLAVLGLLTSKSVEGVLQDESIQIDETDHTGRTALSWATLRGDVEATRILLSHGADCNWVDGIGNTPLSYAVRTCSKCTELLLHAKADVHVKDSYKATLISRSLPFHEDGLEALRVVEYLVEAGVDVNAARLSGETALQTASEYGRLEVVEYLLKHGADPTICNGSGANPLCQATQRNHHSLIRLFLQERQDHTQELTFYTSFMHLAAEFADTKSLQLLAQGGLKRRDICMKNKQGLTPDQFSRRRKNVDSEWREAFSQFLESIDKDVLPAGHPGDANRSRRGTGSTSNSEVEESDEEFQDAVEFQT